MNETINKKADNDMLENLANAVSIVSACKICCALRVAYCVLRVACYVLRVSCFVFRVSCCVLHVSRCVCVYVGSHLFSLFIECNFCKIGGYES
jgi:hypothetical protein